MFWYENSCHDIHSCGENHEVSFLQGMMSSDITQILIFFLAVNRQLRHFAEYIVKLISTDLHKIMSEEWNILLVTEIFVKV